jgi:acyl carrier protein
MEEKLKSIMSTVFQVEINEINSDASPSNLSQWDSMNHLNLVISIEEEFNLNLNDSQIVEMVDFNSILKIIKSLKSST